MKILQLALVWSLLPKPLLINGLVDAIALSAIIVDGDMTGPFLMGNKGYQPSKPRKLAQVIH